jgi:hypothetical protein
MLKPSARRVLDTREASLVKREASESGTRDVSRSTLHERRRVKHPEESPPFA